MTGPHGDMTLIEHLQAAGLRRLVASLTAADDHTRAINDQAREVPDWQQIKAELGSEW